jgi:hypothetical protein
MYCQALLHSVISIEKLVCFGPAFNFPRLGYNSDTPTYLTTDHDLITFRVSVYSHYKCHKPNIFQIYVTCVYFIT